MLTIIWYRRCKWVDYWWHYVVRKMEEDSDLEMAVIDAIKEKDLAEVAKAIYFLKNNQNYI